MDYKFTQPASMRVTKEQYERDLREPLLKMGYEEALSDWTLHPILTTNLIGNDSYLSNIRDHLKSYNSRYFIPDYNPELLLAIAAMTDSVSPIVGEWIVYTDSMAEMLGLRARQLYRFGKLNTNTRYMRKATLQELIEKFTNQKQDIMKKELTLELIKDLKNLISPENMDKFNELMGIKKPIPKKEELITGDKVILRNGETYLLIRDCNAGLNKNQTFALLQCEISAGFMNSDAYDNNLSAGMTEFDVMRIYRSGEGEIRGNSFSKDLKGYSLIWER